MMDSRINSAFTSKVIISSYSASIIQSEPQGLPICQVLNLTFGVFKVTLMISRDLDCQTDDLDAREGHTSQR